MGIRSAAFIPGSDIMVGEIPAAFWDDNLAFHGVEAGNGVVVGDLCRLLWASLGKAGEPPAALEVRINREDMDVVFPPKH
jgi:hypothetical protein